MVSKSAMIRLAKKSPYTNWKHGAIVFKGGCVVGMATNDRRTHAEVRALSQTKYPKNTTVLSVRVNKSGDLCNALPCLNCWNFMKKEGVKTVFYSTDAGSIERIRI